jgi:hypothetical protein
VLRAHIGASRVAANHHALIFHKPAKRFLRQVDTAPQGVRFARPDILFYDAHRIDLYQWISALYLMA